MTKRQLIDDIRRYNTTAQPQFLAQFDDSALKDYLDHLEAAEKNNLRIGGRVRESKRSSTQRSYVRKAS